MSDFALDEILAITVEGARVRSDDLGRLHLFGCGTGGHVAGREANGPRSECCCCCCWLPDTSEEHAMSGFTVLSVGWESACGQNNTLRNTYILQSHVLPLEPSMTASCLPVAIIRFAELLELHLPLSPHWIHIHAHRVSSFVSPAQFLGTRPPSRRAAHSRL